MRLTKILLMTLIVVSSGSIFADDTAMLINLDKQWGSAGGPDGFVSDDVVGIGPTGIIGIAEVRQAAVGPSDEEYVVDGYQVNFLSADIAVMGSYSLRVRPSFKPACLSKAGWQVDGRCQCICTTRRVNYPENRLGYIIAEYTQAEF